MRIKNPNELGLLIRSRRQEKVWSQQALANHIGASRHWVIDLERGKPTLEIGLVLRAIVALGLSVDIRDVGQVLSGWGGHLPESGVESFRTAPWASYGTEITPRPSVMTRSWVVPDLGQVLTRARGLDLSTPSPQSPEQLHEKMQKTKKKKSTTNKASTKKRGTKKKGADR